MKYKIVNGEAVCTCGPLMGCEFRLWPFYGFICKELIWVRVGGRGYGLAIKKTPILFSERYGYVKYWRLPFGWRLVILKPRKKPLNL